MTEPIDEVRDGIAVLDDILKQIEQFTSAEHEWQQALGRVLTFSNELGEVAEAERTDGASEFQCGFTYDEVEQLSGDLGILIEEDTAEGLRETLEQVRAFAVRFRQWLVDAELEYDRRVREAQAAR